MVAEHSKTFNDLYRSIGSIPRVASGQISAVKVGTNQTQVGFHYTLSQRDLTRKTTRSYLYNDFVSIVEGKVQHEDLYVNSFPTEFSCVLEAVSPCGTFKVALRHININININTGSDTGSDTKLSRFIEIYKRGTLVHNLDVSSIHEEFYGDSTFGCLSFSKNGHKVVYIAERNLDGFKKVEGSLSKNLVFDDESEAYSYNQDWGETFINKRRPSLFLVHLDQLFEEDLTTSRSTFDYTLDDIVKPICLNSKEFLDQLVDPGQARFSPHSQDTLYFTGYSKSPRKHGIVYCNNRPACIYSVNIDGSHLTRISNPEFSARNPEFLLENNGQFLFYLQSNLGGAHASSSRLIKNDLHQRKEHVLVDFVKDHHDCKNFPGLYPDGLPSTSIELNSLHFITIASQWRSRKVLLGINIDSNECQNVKLTLLSESLDEKGSAFSYLHAKSSYLLASRSKPNLPSELLFGHAYLSTDNQLAVQWTSIKQWGHDLKINGHPINQINWEVFSLPERDNRLECILIKAITSHPNTNQPSLIINIHGGPHSGNVEMWNYMNTALSLLGFEILHVNYSGSTGYGDDYVHQLLGHIGDLDVKDCQYAMDHVWNRGAYHRRFVTGGSHGGFLTAHLIGQYPGYYAACALRNPVINVGAMSFLTDIPDWCFAEAGIPYHFNHLALTTPDKYEIMFKASPEQYVDKLSTPILLLLGSEDRRVPPSQGLQWCNHIRARQPDLIKIRLIPKVGHPLDSIEAESISLAQIGKHFLSYI